MQYEQDEKDSGFLSPFKFGLLNNYKLEALNRHATEYTQGLEQELSGIQKSINEPAYDLFCIDNIRGYFEFHVQNLGRSQTEYKEIAFYAAIRFFQFRKKFS